MKKLFLILVFLISSSSVQAAEKAQECTASNVGMVHCFEDRMCECKFFPASEMAQTPQRFGWDCGINRPTCLNYQDITSPPQPYNGPSSVIIDKNNGSTNSQK